VVVKNKLENHAVINYVCKFLLLKLNKGEFLFLIRKPSDCHHAERESHLCHFDECPNCKQQCNLPLKDCLHLCPAICHDSVFVKEEINSSNTPWGIKEKEKLIKKSLSCPPCQVPITVSCFGQHTV
jgi:NF-X1-type zinc finger protein NFXL1